MIVSRPTIAKICDELRTLGNKIVFTNGCFDIIHVGHIKHLAQSKNYGDILVVGLNSDSSVKRLKGNDRPINKEVDRGIVLSALSAVDFVCIFEEDTPLELIKIVKPDVITKGGDYTIENIVGAEFVINNGGKVIVNNFVDGKSSTSIINKLKQ